MNNKRHIKRHFRKIGSRVMWLTFS